jgi:hypothetical protein
MAVKTEHILLGVAGGGALLIGGYLWYGDYEKNKHINDYLSKVKRAEAEYKNAIDAGNYDEAQRVADFYQGLMKEEEKVIDHEGGTSLLIRRLAQLGYVVIPGVIAYQIISWFIKRHPPPTIKCPYEGSTFSSEAALEQHLLDVHGKQLNPAQVPAAKGAYDRLKDWIKGLLSAVSGVERSVLDGNWSTLPTIDIVAIALAAALIIALIFLDPFGWFAGLPAIAAMVV